MKPFGLVIHGGAGVILREEMSCENDAAYRAKLEASLAAGYEVLERGLPATEAVVAAIRILEDSPLFNAGYGAVLDSEGRCELDAAIMEGRTLAAGAVTGVRTVKNPILLAEAVMRRSPHVMLAGPGAERFAGEAGLEIVSNDYFKTERRVHELEHARELERADPSDRARQGLQERILPPRAGLADERKWGTVGCAALDKNGDLAAGTSTGGLTNKRFGRVGDSPIIGAGTYANNATCALSCTGHGEYFIRQVVGHDISAQMEYKGVGLEEAATATLVKVAKLGGDGGLVAIDRDGRVSMPFTTPGMYRGFRLSGGGSWVEIYGKGS